MSRPSKQLKEKECALCGKIFIYRDCWAYKRTSGDRVQAFCSWSCLRKAEEAGETWIKRSEVQYCKNCEHCNSAENICKKANMKIVLRRGQGRPDNCPMKGAKAS